MTTLPDLDAIIRHVEKAGRALAAEFTRPGGPRGRGDHADIDDIIAHDLRRDLTALFAARWVCEETETLPGSIDGYCWLVDPHDGTTAYLDGHRGTAISVALLHRGEPVLGVVHAPLPPDRGPDTIAWADGMDGAIRDGRLLPAVPAGRRLDPGAIVFVSHTAAGKPMQNAELVAPGRFVALPSIAYRLARAACGDGVAAVSLNGPCGWDYAGGHALLRGAGGVLLDQTGEEVRYTEHGASRVSFCFGGAPEAAVALVRRNWNEVFRGKSLPGFGLPPTPRMAADHRLDRATGCLFGLIAGDSLGGQVEFAAPQAIARRHPQGVTTSPRARHVQSTTPRRQVTAYARAACPTTDNGGQAMAGKGLKDVVDAWVAREEIRGVREIDRPGDEYSIAFDYNIGDQTFEVFVDVEEEIGVLSVYIYAPIRAPEKRADELIRLFNRKNGQLRIGSLEVVGERRSIRYRASMPARPDALLPDDIERLVQLGGDLFHDLFPQVMAVLFGDVSAEDAWDMAKAPGKDQVLN